MQKARRHPDKSELRPLVSVWFQVLFTLLFGVLFTFPSRYWFTIGLLGVFSLTGWCRLFQTEFHLLRHTQDTAIKYQVAFTGLSPSTVHFPKWFMFPGIQILQSYYPTTAVTVMVWASPRSLATTCGITIVFFSSG